MKQTARIAFATLVVAALMVSASARAQDNPPAAPQDAAPMMMKPDAGAAPDAGANEPPMQMSPDGGMMGQMGMMEMMMMMMPQMAEMMELCMQMMQTMMGGDAGGNP